LDYKIQLPAVTFLALGQPQTTKAALGQPQIAKAAESASNNKRAKYDLEHSLRQCLQKNRVTGTIENRMADKQSTPPGSPKEISYIITGHTSINQIVQRLISIHSVDY
jgi:hypothetical protein